MKASKISALLLLAPVVFLTGCDTTLNVKSPASSYFIKYFGNEGSQTGTDFIVNKDGTIVLFGTTQKGNEDPRFYLVKADAKGNFMWERKFGTAKCQARDVELASDGRIVVLGNIIAAGRTDYDIYLKTFSQDGQVIDSLPPGKPDYKNAITGEHTNEDAMTVTQTNDGFIVAGSSGNIAHPSDPTVIKDPLFLRVDDNLAIYSKGTWPDVPAYGRATENISTKIVQLPDLSFYVFGYTKYKEDSSPQTDFDFWYFKMSPTGDPAKGENFIPSPGKDQKLFSVTADTTSLGNGFFLAGLETDVTGAGIYITRLVHPPLGFIAADALPIEPKSLNFALGPLSTVLNPQNPSNEFVSACLSKGSGYLILTNQVTSGNSNLLLTKVGNTDRDVGWTTAVIFGGLGDDFAGSVQELPDGKIVIVGTMTVGQASLSNGETKMVMIKVNKNGQFSD